MNRCLKCHRPLKSPTPTGMGRICAAKVAAVPMPDHERDLFGYEVEKGLAAARYRLQVHIESMAAEAYVAVRDAFRAARERLLGWEPRT
jgi:hypothetical protein